MAKAAEIMTLLFEETAPRAGLSKDAAFDRFSNADTSRFARRQPGRDRPDWNRFLRVEWLWAFRNRRAWLRRLR